MMDIFQSFYIAFNLSSATLQISVFYWLGINQPGQHPIASSKDSLEHLPYRALLYTYAHTLSVCLSLSLASLNPASHICICICVHVYTTYFYRIVWTLCIQFCNLFPFLTWHCYCQLFPHHSIFVKSMVLMAALSFNMCLTSYLPISMFLVASETNV